TTPNRAANRRPAARGRLTPLPPERSKPAVMLAGEATPHPDYPPRTARASGALQRRTSAPAAASVRTTTDSAPCRKLHHAQPPSRPPGGTAPKQDSRTGRSDRQVWILAPAISRWTTSVLASVIIDPAQCCPSLNSQRPTACRFSIARLGPHDVP